MPCPCHLITVIIEQPIVRYVPVITDVLALSLLPLAWGIAAAVGRLAVISWDGCPIPRLSLADRRFTPYGCCGGAYLPDCYGYFYFIRVHTDLQVLAARFLYLLHARS